MHPTRFQRERIPTIFGDYEPVEKFLRQRRTTDPHRDEGAVSPSPLDAMLIARFLESQTETPVVVDLASDATRGLSTLLVSTCASVRWVCEHRSPTSDDNEKKLRQRFLEEWDSCCLERIQPKTDSLESAEWTAFLASLRSESAVVFLLHAETNAPENLESQIRSCLSTVPHASCLVLGLGKIGQCSALARLVSLSDSDSTFQLALFRESESVFAASRLGHVSTAKGERDVDTLHRIGQLYHSNFDYLDAVQTLSMQCVQASPHVEEMPNFEPPSPEEGSLLRRICLRLAPPKTIRHRFLKKSYRTLLALARRS